MAVVVPDFKGVGNLDDALPMLGGMVVSLVLGDMLADWAVLEVVRFSVDILLAALEVAVLGCSLSRPVPGGVLDLGDLIFGDGVELEERLGEYWCGTVVLRLRAGDLV